MRIVEIRERTIPISRYNDSRLPSGGLTTSLVAIATDAVRAGKRVVGYGFSSVGRFGQSGLIRERFAPRLLAAQPQALTIPDRDGLDPFACWSVMMSGEKLGGHGERCVAVGTLDMAIWDAAAKLASMPLEQFITERLEGKRESSPRAFVYAGGGYLYPDRDIACLTEEIRRFLDLGFSHAKIKIGAAALGTDIKRVEAAARLLPGGKRLAVDAMNTYSIKTGIAAAKALTEQDLWWFEDPCDPLDFDAQTQIAEACRCPVAAGEALFSLAEAKLLDKYGGLDRRSDILVFDPVHCYGLTGYLQILDYLLARGWPSSAFWPHGGSLFCQHVVIALGLGGAEINPLAFAPFRGFADGQIISDGYITLPDHPGIGFERHPEIWNALKSF